MRAADGRRQRLLGLSLVIGPAIGLGYGREISDSGDGGFFDGQNEGKCRIWGRRIVRFFGLP